MAVVVQHRTLPRRARGPATLQPAPKRAAISASGVTALGLQNRRLATRKHSSRFGVFSRSRPAGGCRGSTPNASTASSGTRTLQPAPNVHRYPTGASPRAPVRDHAPEHRNRTTTRSMPYAAPRTALLLSPPPLSPPLCAPQHLSSSRARGPLLDCQADPAVVPIVRPSSPCQPESRPAHPVSGATDSFASPR